MAPPRRARPPQTRNRLLNLLPAREFQSLSKKLVHIPFTMRQPIYDLDAPIDHVYFPEEGVISLIAELHADVQVEVATIGNEGMAGVPLYLGVDQSAQRAFVQIPGDGYCMAAGDFRAEIARRESLRTILNRYVQALFTQIAQTSACNRAHKIEQRCARWILMTHDRVSGDEFSLTQEFLAQMLGVRRASVGEVTASLQRADVIAYSRGRMHVLDRKQLEAIACECYAIVARRYDELLG